MTGEAFNPAYPRLRHCTFVERDDGSLLMIVGRQHFTVTELAGSREKLFETKRYLDGRHSIHEIGRVTGIPEQEIDELVATLRASGLLRSETPVAALGTVDFLARVKDSCTMWSRQIGCHRLFGTLERGEVRKEVFIGLILETYHYVTSTPRHAAVALAHCRDERWACHLADYIAEERGHGELLLRALERMGLPRAHVLSAHPLIGTQSLFNMLCEIGRRSTLAWIACTSLFEVRIEEFEQAKASLLAMGSHYGFGPEVLDPVIEHAYGDVAQNHVGLLMSCLEGRAGVNAADAHEAVNCLHDLKHAFDQYHDQVLQYYTDVSNYIPRLPVDYFSL